MHATIREAIESVRRAMATHPRDWAEDHRDAWVWGVLFGWDADAPDDVDAMDEVAARHGWTPELVARLRRLHDAINHVAPEDDMETNPRIIIRRHTRRHGRLRAQVEEAIRQQRAGQNVVVAALEPESLPPWARKALEEAGVKVVFSKQRKTAGK